MNLTLSALFTEKLYIKFWTFSNSAYLSVYDCWAISWSSSPLLIPFHEMSLWVLYAHVKMLWKSSGTWLLYVLQEWCAQKPCRDDMIWWAITNEEGFCHKIQNKFIKFLKKWLKWLRNFTVCRLHLTKRFFVSMFCLGPGGCTFFIFYFWSPVFIVAKPSDLMGLWKAMPSISVDFDIILSKKVWRQLGERRTSKY